MALVSLKNELNQYDWQPWLERPFWAFLLSLFAGGSSKKAFAELGIEAKDLPWVFQSGSWYESKSAMKIFAEDLKIAREQGLTIFTISEECVNFYQQAETRVEELVAEDGDPFASLKEVYKFLQLGTTYIWLAHGWEEMLDEILRNEIKKYPISDPDKFVGDVSFPEKPNAHALMEKALRDGEDVTEIQKKFGWIKAREGFSPAFTVQELEELRTEVLAKPETRREPLEIPAGLEALIGETRELIYYRTLRTDLFYRLLFLARPIITRVAEKLGVSFEDLKYCSVLDLVEGQYKPYPTNANGYDTGREFLLTIENLVERKINETKEVKGKIAFPGVAHGMVKIVKTPADCDKVLAGDILVTQMTFPSFIMAMKRAAAFVTDEGGITCHAAIVAREMKKPCVIGTQVATKVLKDGDQIEVDAEQGIVRKI